SRRSVRQRTTDHGQLTSSSLFGRFACHHFFRRHLHRALGGALDDPHQAVVLGLGKRAALGQLDRVALLGVVLLVVRVQHGAALEVLAVLRVLHLVVHDDLDRLIALVRRHHTDDGAEVRTFGLLYDLLFCHFVCRHFVTAAGCCCRSRRIVL